MKPKKTSSANGVHKPNGAIHTDSLPVPKLFPKLDRTEEALRRLKVSPSRLAAAPSIMWLLAHADGGLKAVMTAMRASPDDVIQTFLRKYDRMNRGDRDYVPWEAICLAAKLDVRQVLGAILQTLVSTFGNISKILAVTSHPKVMRAAIRYAQRPSGDKDRKDLHTMVGALPSPKGTTFIGHAVFGAGDAKESETVEAETLFTKDDDPNLIFPDALTMQEKLIAIRQRQLPAGNGHTQRATPLKGVPFASSEPETEK